MLIFVWGGYHTSSPVFPEFAFSSDARVIGCLEAEREALIDFKDGLEDPENRLSSWRGRNCCQWWGIQCSNTTSAVIAVDLHNLHPLIPYDDSSSRYGFWNLSGEIRPSLKMLESLKHLDLSFNTFNGISIPAFFGSLKNLQYLNLSNAGFSGRVSPNLGNLSSLQYLDVSSNFLSVDNLEWMTGMRSMEYLNMNGADLSMLESEWIETLNKLSSLTDLHLSDCGFSGFIPSPTVINFTSLAVIELDFNSFNSEIPSWLVNISSLEVVSISICGLYGRIPLGFSELPNLKVLDLTANKNLTASCSQLFKGGWQKIEVISLSLNKLHGELPASFGNLTTLTHFDLSLNNVEGGIPSSIGNCSSRTPLPSLQYFDVSVNRLVGELPEWLGQLENVVELTLSHNSLYGPIPSSLGSSTITSSMGLRHKKLNGTLPESLGKLYLFDVSFNHLTGIVTEAHFSKLRKLKLLHLSSNSLILNFSSNGKPPFQAWDLELGSCNMGPSFPAWLRSQKEVNFLDISNASISGSIPNWFWEISSNLSILNISFNQLGGQLPNRLNVKPYAVIDMSSNFFEGPIPLPTATVELLDLSNNAFSGHIPKTIGETMLDLIFLSLLRNQLIGEIPASICKFWSLAVIDLSNNMLNGNIPPSIGNCSYLEALDLSKNNLSGNIPSSLAQLTMLKTLHLSDNKLSGDLSQSLQNMSSLETLDIGNNMLTGRIPPWIGKGFEHLRILRLRSNAFFGELPMALSNLSSLHVLDLAENQFNGSIPASFGDFKAMAQAQNMNRYLFYGMYRGSYYDESLIVNLKGSPQKYTKTLSLVISIDLSGNNLSGDLPEEITKLSGLVVLNLSGNQISGGILQDISKLTQLQSLDLSSNRFSGLIPQSLSSLSFLGYLNLSNNDFSGMIPYTAHLTTFDAASFAGNPGLCGPPLVVSCPGADPGKGGGTVEDNDSGNSFIDKWFYLSVGLGFAAGLLVPFFILAIRKPWSDAYFCFVDKVLERISCLRNRSSTSRTRRPQLS
ncbi:LRR receptor-like serine/threonine-protein kinase GSO2 [Prunus yedoensis var. nudiflora]|uniref:LRR receptor-like serine/threonine-protein kinase GSO2 n=1 Tax=Prunus yedoensis var. nudiflora TaxID=2094558 RepID=A0A314XSS9_PRUYE|nr:LRR receptor-like serine/threonine-protein kinase GSO2 [Prunus yedoensis var. nudiflora]